MSKSTNPRLPERGTDAGRSPAEIFFAAGFLPTPKPGHWSRGDLRIIERQIPCCTGIVMPEPPGIPDRDLGKYEYGTYATYDLLNGHSRIGSSTDAAAIITTASALPAES